MDSPNLNAMLVVASELAMQGRWLEAADLSRQVVAAAPSEHQAWWLLGQAYDKLQRQSEARDAYAEYYRRAPRHAGLRAVREFAAAQAGVSIEADTDPAGEADAVMFTATIDGKVALIHAVNDSGKTFDEVKEAADTFVRSRDPFNAWMHAQKHPELLTSFGDTILTALAQTQTDPAARAGVERHRDALRRVRDGAGVAPFAEIAQISASDFMAFVSVADDVQPVLQQLLEAATDAERQTILAANTAMVRDDRTLTFLRLLGGLQPNAHAREAVQFLFTTIHQARRASAEPDSPLVPYQHAVMLLQRYEEGGRPGDLDEGIAALRQVLTLVVDGTVMEGAARSVLGGMLMRRAERTGSLADLDEAIEAQRLAVTADGDPDAIVARFCNLATSHQTRFDISGSIGDLDEAERAYGKASGLSTPNHAVLVGLARVYRSRYRVSARLELLDAAIDRYREGLEHPAPAIERGLTFNNLSSALRDRYQARGDISDIDEAIEASKSAVAALPDGHIHRPKWLENLANNLRVRANTTQTPDDRRDAMRMFEAALASAPEGSDVWRSAASNLGAMIESEDPERSLELQETGFGRLAAGARHEDIVQAAEGLAAAHARRQNWARAAAVLLTGMNALEQLQRTQLLPTAKRAWLGRFGSLHLLTAEVLLRAERWDEALVAVERGRGRLLAEALDRDRAALAELERRGDQRAVQRYRTAAEQVRALTAAAERGANVAEPLAAATRALDASVTAVREATGGLAFAQPLAMADIMAAADSAGAPLVYLVPLEHFGVAFVLPGGAAEGRAVPLPQLTADTVDKAVNKYVTAYERSVASPGSSTWQQWTQVLDETVRWCWDACMRDVVANLDGASSAVLLPVGSLGRLPLHAASGSGGDALDAMISTHAPNARSFAQLAAPSERNSILTVAFAPASSPLPFAALETAAARRAFPIERALEGEGATVAAVLDAVRNASVAHFACHASAPGDDALAGGVELADGSVSLRELLDARLAAGGLAVLSACETGVIGEKLPDEVLTLASAMLQSGVSGVIASLWSVPDASTAVLMARFYHAWRNEQQPPPAALRTAQRWMRDSDNAAIAAFLRATGFDGVARDLVSMLDAEPSGAAFREPVHWAAFTYSGR